MAWSDTSIAIKFISISFTVFSFCLAIGAVKNRRNDKYLHLPDTNFRGLEQILTGQSTTTLFSKNKRINLPEAEGFILFLKNLTWQNHNISSRVLSEWRIYIPSNHKNDPKLLYDIAVDRLKLTLMI